MRLTEILNPHREPPTILDQLLSESYQIDKKYREMYNELASKEHPLKAYSYLVQAKNGINDVGNYSLEQGDFLLSNGQGHSDYDLHVDILIHLLALIVNEGYPSSLRILYEEEYEKEIKKKMGRPLDKIAPQEKIESVVRNLISEKRFLNHQGKPKPTTIRDELIRNYPNLVGELSERAVFNRVKKALKNLDMQ